MTPFNSSAVAATNIHSIHRLNDDTPTAAQTYCRIIGGANGTVYTDNSAHTAFTSRSTGFSGNPLTFATFRPNQSPSPYTYIGDSTKMEKITVAGGVSKMGIVHSNTAPTYAFTTPTRTSVDDFNNAGSWTSSGIAGTGALKIATTVSIGTITRILYDSGTTGFCSIQPSTTYAGITEGNRILINSGGGSAETVIIEKVLAGITTTTIASITYDSGTTGLCTIVLAHNSRHRVVPDALILINGTETVRIISTAIGDDDQQSFRCSTTSNHAAAESVAGLTSVRVYTVNNHAAGEALATPVIQLGCTGATTGIATITKTGLTLDLSQISGRPVQDTDEMYFAVRVTPATEVSELQIMLDCGSGTFTENFYVMAIKPSDFQSALTQTQTTTNARQNAIQTTAINTTDVQPSETIEQLRQRLQRRLEKAQQNNNPKRVRQLTDRLRELDYPTIPRVDLPTGNGQTTIIGQSGSDQWWIMRFRISDLTRIGADATVGLKNINALRINAFITGSTGVGDPLFQFASWWVGGTYGADVGTTGRPYLWRYRYRSKTTGAISYWSPPMRSGADAKRQRVALTPVASADAQVDAIDWARWGGSIPVWKYIGTGANSTAVFNDDFPDDSILDYDNATFNSFVPFVVADLPKTGVCNVSGTRVTRVSGDNFDTSWIEGTEIIIDGKSFTLYSSPSSTSTLDTIQNVGTKSNVAFYLPSPAKCNTPLPAIWAYTIDKGSTVIFGCGDTLNAGILYWTNPDDPDSMSPLNYVDVTSPSEPLMNGFVYDSRCYVFTPNNLYAIYPTQDLEGVLRFAPNKTPLSKGIAGRYAFCVGEGAIWFVDRDGIYFTNGSQPQSITDEDLYPLFPHDGNVGVTTNGFIPPDFSSPNNLRLAVGDSILRFEYLGTDTNRYTAVYDIERKAWSVDEYSPDVVMSYFDEGRTAHNWILGCTDGRIYANTGVGDGVSSNTAFTSEFRTRDEDIDSPNARKFIASAALDFESTSLSQDITAQLGFDNYTVLPAAITLNAAVINKRQISSLPISSGAGIYAKTVALDVLWQTSTERAKFYNWQVYYDPKDDDVTQQATALEDGGMIGVKFWQGFIIKANTYGVVKDFKIQADNGANGLWTDIETFTIRTDNEASKPYSFETPFLAHNVRLVATDTDSWSLTDIQYIFEPDAELVAEWIAQPTTFGFTKYTHLGWMYVTHRSTVDWVFTWIVDNVTYSYTITNSGGVVKKDFIRLKSIKGKVWQPKAESSDETVGFRLYQKDLAVAIKEWGSGDGYQVIKPIGGLNSVNGALI